MSQEIAEILTGFIEERGFNVKTIFKKDRTVITISAPHFEIGRDDFVGFIIMRDDTCIQVTCKGVPYNSWIDLDLHDPNSLHKLEDMMNKAAIE